MQRGFAHLIILISIIVVIVLIAGGIYYLGTRKNQAMQPPIQQTTSSPTPISDPTANWKTYTNKKYNYSIQYPPDWDSFGNVPNQPVDSIEDPEWINIAGPNGCKTKHCGYLRIVVKKVGDKDLRMSAEEIWLRDFGQDVRPNIVTKKNIELNGIKAIEISYVINFLGGQTSKATAPVPMKAVIWKRDNQIYDLSIIEYLYMDRSGISPEYAVISEWIYTSLYDQILSTFKFLDTR